MLGRAKVKTGIWAGVGLAVAIPVLGAKVGAAAVPVAIVAVAVGLFAGTGTEAWWNRRWATALTLAMVGLAVSVAAAGGLR